MPVLNSTLMTGDQRAFDTPPAEDTAFAQRDAFLYLERVQDTLKIQASSGQPAFPGPHFRGGTVKISEVALHALIGRCRKVWQNALAHMDEDSGEAPFIARWDFRDQPQYLSEVAPDLAVAGSQLRAELFALGDPDLKALSDELDLAMRAGPRTITIHSEDCFVPWPLLYTHPTAEGLKVDGSNWMKEGFWGYRHQIEHRVKKECRNIELGGPDAINVGMHLDLNLGSPDDPILEAVTAALRKEPRVRVVERASRTLLLEALADGSFTDNISYFCCHAVASGSDDHPTSALASFQLTDGKRIDVGDIRSAAMKRPLSCNPLIFLNMCEGGQMATWSYRAIARELLEMDATCVIGAQIDIPIVVAPVYAERFFSALLASPPARVGTTVHSLAQSFWDDHHNPLGLIYSMYRGIDAYIPPARG